MMPTDVRIENHQRTLTLSVTVIRDEPIKIAAFRIDEQEGVRKFRKAGERGTYEVVMDDGDYFCTDEDLRARLLEKAEVLKGEPGSTVVITLTVALKQKETQAREPRPTLPQGCDGGPVVIAQYGKEKVRMALDSPDAAAKAPTSLEDPIPEQADAPENRATLISPPPVEVDATQETPPVRIERVTLPIGSPAPDAIASATAVRVDTPTPQEVEPDEGAPPRVVVIRVPNAHDTSSTPRVLPPVAGAAALSTRELSALALPRRHFLAVAGITAAGLLGTALAVRLLRDDKPQPEVPAATPPAATKAHVPHQQPTRPVFEVVIQNSAGEFEFRCVADCPARCAESTALSGDALRFVCSDPPLQIVIPQSALDRTRVGTPQRVEALTLPLPE